MTAKPALTGNDLESLVATYCEKPTEVLLVQIMEASRGLVYHFASQYAWGSDLDDLTQAGFEGVLKALSRFEPARQVLFATYSSHYIKGEIRRELSRGNPFSKPPLLVDIQSKINSATEELRQSLAREPSLKEIAQVVNIREEGVTEALLAGSIPLEELNLSRIRSLRYESFQLPIEDRLLLQEALSKLNDMQKKIVYWVFYQDLTQTRIAELLGTNQRRVSRLLKKTLEQLALYMVC